MRSFFYYTKKERRGIILLSILCFLLFAAQWVLPYFSRQETYDFASFQQELAQAGMTETKSNHASSLSTDPESLFPFNPNEVSKAELQQLGLSATAVRAWLSYLKKGGRFRSIDDVKGFRRLSDTERDRILPFVQFDQAEATPSSIPAEEIAQSIELYPFNPNNITQQELSDFGLPKGSIRAWMSYRSKGGYFKDENALASFRALSPEDLDRLKPYLQFETEEKLTPILRQAQDKLPTPEPQILDINQASAQEWQSLRGIGPAYSKRIIKFRDALGGFISIAQIADTYGLPDSVYQSIQPFLQASPVFRKLAVNQLKEADLAKHPYVDRKTAALLVAYRSQHGPYADLEAMRAVRLPQPAVLDKIAPYLDFTP